MTTAADPPDVERARLTPSADPGSFRDPHSRILHRGDAVLRALDADGLADFEALAATSFFEAGQQNGRIVRTTRVESPDTVLGELGDRFTALLQHERIPSVSYPYEWSFSMLRAAALLTLELTQEALSEGLIMKDASSYNVQFRGAQPVFIDVGSFERLRPGEPWHGYRQFCQLFLYPLMLVAYKGTDFQPWLRGAIDGITPSQMRALMSGRDQWRKGVLKHVTLHAKLQSSFGDSRAAMDVQNQVKQAGFKTEFIAANLRNLHAVASSLHWGASSSEWSGYRTDNSYSDADVVAKDEFVRAVVAQRRRRLAWDLGANDGRYSRIAAEGADHVIALDADHLTVDRLHADLRAEGSTAILPLVMDLANPSPGLGWGGVERPALADRGRPDLVLALALIHHLAITANVPLDAVVSWLATLGAELVIEFPTTDDPQVQRLLRNKRPGVHDDYRLDAFEAALSRHFDVARREPLPSGRRVLFHAT